MNREIELRAWHNNKMYEVAKIDLWGDPDQTTCDLAPLDFSEDELFDVYLQDVVLMQLTGLYDKNGKEIYEGDILQFAIFDYNDHDTHYKGIVKFAEGEYQIWNSIDSEFYNSDGAFHLFQVHYHDSEIEIIGNIYENPELLEVNQ